MVGVMESLMGILRLGWLVHFIRHSIISGFTSASAIIIAFSQAKSFLGYSITRSSKIVPLIESIYAGRSQGKTFKHLRFFRAAGLVMALFGSTVFVKLVHHSSISVVYFLNHPSSLELT
ncbi:hypothetical protein BDL97_01G032600 [Sphagnum fallax]|nr:hypothetical protein BDL97_01G032600 [Sphagnum fallax]